MTAKSRGRQAKSEPVIIRRRPVLELKTVSEIAKMRRAGKVVGTSLELVRQAVRPGVTTAELDAVAAKYITGEGCIPSFLNYCGYPAVLCASVNNEVVHGIPGGRKLIEGDIISIDLGASFEGYHADSAITVAVGAISRQAQHLMDVTRESLVRGMGEMRPGGYLGDVSHAVQAYVERNGMSVVRDFVGHGIGRSLHEEPAVPNYGLKGTGVRLEPGVVLAIEPMVNQGDWQVEVQENGWTVVTCDGSLSAHFEHTVAVTENGHEVLTLP